MCKLLHVYVDKCFRLNVVLTELLISLKPNVLFIRVFPRTEIECYKMEVNASVSWSTVAAPERELRESAKHDLREASRCRKLLFNGLFIDVAGFVVVVFCL